MPGGAEHIPAQGSRTLASSVTQFEIPGRAFSHVVHPTHSIALQHPAKLLQALVEAFSPGFPL